MISVDDATPDAKPAEQQQSSFRIYCTDCHAITPSDTEQVVCPTCQCPRIYCAELDVQR